MHLLLFNELFWRIRRVEPEEILTIACLKKERKMQPLPWRHSYLCTWRSTSQPCRDVVSVTNARSRKIHNPLQLSILLSPTYTAHRLILLFPLGVTYISYAVVIFGERSVLCLQGIREPASYSASQRISSISSGSEGLAHNPVKCRWWGTEDQ